MLEEQAAVNATPPAAASSKQEASAAEESLPSFGEILSHLEETLEGDSNMFGAAANSHRDHGVFTNEFMDFLEAEMKQCQDAARREGLQRVQARIVNPLLKQGEFY